jgi:hypothetical protein
VTNPASRPGAMASLAGRRCPDWRWCRQSRSTRRLRPLGASHRRPIGTGSASLWPDWWRSAAGMVIRFRGARGVPAAVRVRASSHPVLWRSVEVRHGRAGQGRPDDVQRRGSGARDLPSHGRQRTGREGAAEAPSAAHWQPTARHRHHQAGQAHRARATLHHEPRRPANRRTANLHGRPVRLPSGQASLLEWIPLA